MLASSLVLPLAPAELPAAHDRHHQVEQDQPGRPGPPQVVERLPPVRHGGDRVAGPDQGGLAARIRSARLVPYQLVIGARESAAGLVSVRLRDGRRIDPLPAIQVLAGIAALAAAHRPELWDGQENAAA